MERTPNRPRTRANEVKGDFAQFTEFMRRLVAVPHDKIKAQLDAEREEKKRKRASRASSDKG
jgi:hypothetical protein